MKVFLTGITGLLGNNVARCLVERGDHVSALVRGKSDDESITGVDLEIVRGDLDSTDAIDRAVQACDVIIHSAAMIHLGWLKMDQSMKVNRDGTAHVADAALRHGKRMVLVGTVNTLALSTGGVPATEETVINHENRQVPCSYVSSKRASVDVVTDRIAKGLDAVIVHPGFMLGPFDWKPSSGRMMLEIGRSYTPIWPVGGCSVCDVRDVAWGLIAALDRGTTGRQYILAGHNWTYKTLWSEMAVRMGRAKPIVPVLAPLRVVAGTIGDLYAAMTHHEGDINSAAVKMSAQFHWYSSARAIEELGYTTRSAKETLDDAANWIKARFF